MQVGDGSAGWREGENKHDPLLGGARGGFLGIKNQKEWGLWKNEDNDCKTARLQDKNRVN